MSANVALVCLFSPKVWIIIFEKEKNVRKLDGDMISRRFDFIKTIFVFMIHSFIKLLKISLGLFVILIGSN